MKKLTFIPGFKLYMVSSSGKIYSFRRKRPRKLKTSKSGDSYLRVTLRRTGKKPRSYNLARLVAFSFIGPPPTPKHQVNHKDGNKLNNEVSNLEWVTASENIQHAYDYLNHSRCVGVRKLWAELLATI